MMLIEIKHRFDGRVLLAGEYSSLRDAVVAAAKSRANLSGADLSGAYLSGADLSGADLSDQSKCVAGKAVVQIGPIGSRGATLVVFNTDKGLRMQTGCFFGDADAFLVRVMDTHGTNKHATDYRNALELAASMLEDA